MQGEECGKGWFWLTLLEDKRGDLTAGSGSAPPAGARSRGREGDSEARSGPAELLQAPGIYEDSGKALSRAGQEQLQHCLISPQRWCPKALQCPSIKFSSVDTFGCEQGVRGLCGGPVLFMLIKCPSLPVRS